MNSIYNVCHNILYKLLHVKFEVVEHVKIWKEAFHFTTIIYFSQTVTTLLQIDINL